MSCSVALLCCLRPQEAVLTGECEQKRESRGAEWPARASTAHSSEMLVHGLFARLPTLSYIYFLIGTEDIMTNNPRKLYECQKLLSIPEFPPRA